MNQRFLIVDSPWQCIFRRDQITKMPTNILWTHSCTTLYWQIWFYMNLKCSYLSPTMPRLMVGYPCSWMVDNRVERLESLIFPGWRSSSGFNSYTKQTPTKTESIWTGSKCKSLKGGVGHFGETSSSALEFENTQPEKICHFLTEKSVCNVSGQHVPHSQ